MSTTAEAPSFQYLQKTHTLGDTANMVKSMEDDGFVLVPGALNPDEVKAMRDAIDGLKPIGFDHAGEGKTHHFKNVFNQNPYFLQFIDRPGLIEMVEGCLTGDCHIIGETAWRSYPGHNGGGMHVDQLFFPMPEDVLQRPDVKLPMIFSTLHFYLSDISIELCPTYIVPGTHKSGRGPKAGESEWNGVKQSPVLCKAGDALFFRSEVWHSGSLNATTDQVRYLLQVHYSIRNGSQHFSPFMGWRFNPEVLALATDRQRRLLGDHKPGAYD